MYVCGAAARPALLWVVVCLEGLFSGSFFFGITTSSSLLTSLVVFFFVAALLSASLSSLGVFLSKYLLVPVLDFGGFEPVDPESETELFLISSTLSSVVFDILVALVDFPSPEVRFFGYNR